VEKRGATVAFILHGEEEEEEETGVKIDSALDRA
jgi:hypothetical protein